MKIKLKTPVSYYGGKQSMLKHILPLIPPHKTYVEPFVGGAAVFFAKEKSELECINDLNGHVVTFYKVLKSDFALLRMMIIETPASRQVHREAEFILKNPEAYSDIRVAWAFWVQTNMSFASSIFNGYGYGKTDNGCTKKIHNKRIKFTKELTTRFDYVDIECNDAIKVIQSRDTEDTFHYVDPPYYNSEMGHYKGYTLKDFTNLLDCLQRIKGKFLLSSYASEVLSEYTLRNNWQVMTHTKAIVACKGDRSKMKTEVLTANYDFKNFNLN